MRNYIFNSLQGRYTLATGLIAATLLAAAYFTQMQLQDTRSTTAVNIEARAQLLECSRLIRDSIRKMQQSLTTFLVDPGTDIPRQKIYGHLQDAKKYTAKLKDDLKAQRQDDELRVANLQITLEGLGKEIEKLIDTRTDINRQYPALALARGSMLNKHNEFNTAIALALDEIHQQDPARHNMTAYEHFVQARHLWSVMVSNFRMYLANRLGSFDEAALPLQEQNIILHYQALNKQLAQIDQLNSNNQLGFQGLASLEVIKREAQSWFGDFEKVVHIHNQEDWRADISIIRRSITPYVESIWILLFELDKIIEQAANSDVSMLTRVAENQTRILWSFAGFCIALTFIGYFAFNHTVLRPLRSIAGALKAESEGSDGITLPRTGSLETQALVDSFVAMREQVKERQQALEYNALHDDLTNLANRSCLNEHLEQAIKEAKRQQDNLALLILDLDHFKEVNDTLGHHTGDQLLLKVSNRLSNILRGSDLIARFGGDEFAILLPNANEAHAVQVAEKIVNALLKPFFLQNQQLYIGASIGISIYPQHGLNVESLVQHSDIAMYQAKKNKTGWALYHAEQDQHSVDRLELMNELRSALSQNTLQLHYQPKICMEDGRCESVEALLRWEHPKHGFIRPDIIIAMAEQTGLIHDLTNWVLETAIAQTLRWHRQNLHISVAVNLSANSLQNDRITEYVRTVLNNTGFPARYLTLEITENAMMADPERAVNILSDLDDMGVRISVDDYGTGFSSLGYLKQLPVKELKIDKSFVMDIINDDNDAVIVRSTIDMAHNLGLKVVAEGVENREIWDLLQMLRCDIAQGFFMSKPCSAENCTQWLKAPKLLPVLGTDFATSRPGKSSSH